MPARSCSLNSMPSGSPTMYVPFAGIRVCPSRGARGLLASNLGNHKPTAVGSSGMRLRILALVALCAWSLAAPAKSGAAPPLPDRGPLIALAQADAAPPLPDRNPMRPGKPAEAKPVLPGEQPRVPWTEAEIDDAKAKCKELPAGDPLDYEILPPIKEGISGTPAPVLLHAVGTNPKATINPPATLSCPMA